VLKLAHARVTDPNAGGLCARAVHSGDLVILAIGIFENLLCWGGRQSPLPDPSRSATLGRIPLSGLPVGIPSLGLSSPSFLQGERSCSVGAERDPAWCVSTGRKHHRPFFVKSIFVRALHVEARKFQRS
jgi:hypothetical protein